MKNAARSFCKLAPYLITPAQGYLGIALVSLGCHLRWGLSAGCLVAGALLVADAWRPPRKRKEPTRESV